MRGFYAFGIEGVGYFHKGGIRTALGMGATVYKYCFHRFAPKIFVPSPKAIFVDTLCEFITTCRGYLFLR